VATRQVNAAIGDGCHAQPDSLEVDGDGGPVAVHREGHNRLPRRLLLSVDDPADEAVVDATDRGDGRSGEFDRLLVVYRQNVIRRLPIDGDAVYRL